MPIVSAGLDVMKIVGGEEITAWGTESRGWGRVGDAPVDEPIELDRIVGPGRPRDHGQGGHLARRRHPSAPDLL